MLVNQTMVYVDSASVTAVNAGPRPLSVLGAAMMCQRKERRGSHD